MASTMQLWDYVPSFDERSPGRCERCGGRLAPGPIGKRFCSELCRKRAERSRWKARWKLRGVNKYVGA